MNLLPRRSSLVEQACLACCGPTVETDRMGAPMHRTCIASTVDVYVRESRDYRRWSR